MGSLLVHMVTFPAYLFGRKKSRVHLNRFCLRIFLTIIILYTITTSGSFVTKIQSSSWQGVNPKLAPVFIQIPSLKTVLKVEEAKIKNDEWLMTDKRTAFYGETSAFPGNPGTTIVFAHARENIFALLPLLHEKNIIVLQTPTALYFYQVSGKKIIDPLDVGSLTSEQTGKNNVLAIFTCYGPQDTKRIVFFAPLQVVIPIDQYKRQYI